MPILYFCQVDALAETVSPVVAVGAGIGGIGGIGATAEALSPDTKLVLEEITR